MMTKMGSSMFRSDSRAEGGFTLIEVLVSMVILTVGLVTLLGVFGLAMASTQKAQQGMIAKQLASDAMESIFTARQTSQLNWNQIQNVGNGGLFLDNPQFQPIYNNGADGLAGTADDAAAGTKVMILPGRDGIVGTADDIQMPLSNYTRSIQIAPVLDNNNNVIADLRTISITVRYTPPGSKAAENYVVSGYISQYR
jgi:prepilin-type N-terminal cleavage/methylation domain-containing protein